MRRDFDTLEYSERTFYPREGRSTSDPATEMEERSYPLDGKVKRGISRRPAPYSLEDLVIVVR